MTTTRVLILITVPLSLLFLLFIIINLDSIFVPVEGKVLTQRQETASNAPFDYVINVEVGFVFGTALRLVDN